MEEQVINLLKGKSWTRLSVLPGAIIQEQVSLLVSLQEMKNFLLSYASKVIVEEPSNSYSISVGNRLLARTADGHYLELKVIDNQDGRITAIIQQGI